MNSTTPSLPTHMLCDVDGVIKLETLTVPGSPLFFRTLREKGIQTSLLSNNSRQRGGDIIQWMKDGGMCFEDDDLPQAISSADATALWIGEKKEAAQRIFLIGEAGIRNAIAELNIPLWNDHWNGDRWENDERPTHVVCGFTKNTDYRTMSGAWNAIRNGAQWIGTNPDREYRNARREILPANGAMLAYLQTARAEEPILIGKPGIFMAEKALANMNAQKKKSDIVVIGDTFDQDLVLKENLEEAGWNVRIWMVASGVVSLTEIQKGVEDGWIDAGFDNIEGITAHLQSL
jgi:4-nitrophenyl phosphatase